MPDNTPATITSGPPTQVAYPRRATIRSAFQAFVALCVLVPTIVAVIGSVVDLTAAPAWVVAAIGAGTAVAAIVTRVMAIPGVNDWIARYVSWLAPEPRPVDPGPDGVYDITGGEQ